MPPRAKSKEAIAVILDIGKSMKKESINSNTTIFQEAKRCVMKILEQNIFSESPNEYILILFGSDETKHGLKRAGNGHYENIFVYGNLCRPTFELLRYIEDLNATENEANIADGIVVGADTLYKETAGQKFLTCKLVFVTNFGGRVIVNDFESVINKAITDTGYHLLFMCDSSLQLKTESDSKFSNERRKAEQCFQAIKNVENCNLYSFEEAKEALTFIQTKRVQSAPWFANLYLGSLFIIPIVGYIKTTQSKEKIWTTSKKQDTSVKQETDATSTAFEDTESKSGSCKVSSKTLYFAGDDKTEIEEEDVIRAYAYGSTIVPVTKDDEEAMLYHSERKGFEILFFTSKDNIKVHYNCGDKTMFVAISHSQYSAPTTAAFNALARALYETNCVAIVRYCRLERFTSQLGYLAPVIDSEKVVFTYIRLPFAEDMRYYHFPAFNVAAKDIPTSEQLSLIDDLIDRMDLSKAAFDEDGNKCEALVCENVNDPNIQIKFQQILSKCLKRYEPETVDPFVIPTVFDTENIISKIKEKFLLEDVEEKRSLSPDIDTPIEVDVKKLKVEEPVKVEIVINESQPGKSFSDLVEAGQCWSAVCSKLEQVILKLSANVMGFNDSKILEALQAFRKHAIAKQQIQEYNALLHSLKVKFKGRMIWRSILEKNLSLITKLESECSEITLQEAKSFAA